MGLISRVSSRTYRRIKHIIMAPDPELLAAFNELKKITDQTAFRQQELKSSIEGNQRLAKKDELVNKELAVLPDDRNYYMSVGRMFMMQPKESIVKQLEKRQEGYKKNITDMKAEHEALGKNLTSKKAELQEMMKSKQSK